MAGTDKLIAHTSIYFFGNVLRRLVSFLMLPIYTRYLTTTDYGVIELLATALDFVGIIVGLRIAEGLFRFYSEYESERDKSEVISTGLFLVVMLNLVGIVAVYALSDTVSRMLFDNAGFANLLILYSFTLMGVALIEIPMAYLRALQRPWLFVMFSTIHLALQLSLNIYFIVIRGMRVEGVVYSSVIATLLTSFVLLVYTSTHIKYRFAPAKAKQLISFSWPLIISSVISFYIVFGDRYFLKFFSGFAEVGIYSLGYKFGFLLGFVVANPFFSYWQFERYNVVKQKDARRRLHDVMLLFTVALALFVVIMSIMVKDVLRVMSDPSFWDACRVVPFILVAYTFDALTNYTKLGVLIHKRTHLLIYGNLIAAAVVTIGYLTLIPPLGATGAALATLGAYAVRFFWITQVSQKLYRLDIPWKQISLVTAAGLTFFGLSQFGPEPLLASIFFNLVLIIVFIVSLYLLPILPSGVRTGLTEVLRNPRLAFASCRQAVRHES